MPSHSEGIVIKMDIILALLIILPLLTAPAMYFIARRQRLAFPITAVICAAELVGAAYLFVRGGTATVSVLGVCFAADGFHALYALLTAFAFFVSALFSIEYFKHYKNHARYIFFYLLTLAATEGVFLSADLMTTFIFFEIVSFTSFVWVLHDESPEAVSAAKTYLAVAVLGGMVLLAGILFLSHHAGTLVISELSPSAGVPFYVGVLLLFGFAAKAGMFPLHIWLPKAHPVAPAPASAILSGVLTKVGVYGIIVTTVHLFYGNVRWGAMLLILGVITLLLGAVLALLSVDLKRTLACSSMSQIGFILTGIASVAILGEDGALAAAGVVLYMLNHSMMKLILFSAAGVVHMNLHKLNLNEIRGWGRGKPLLAVLFAWGGLGLAGVPLTGGYIAKTLIHEAIVESAEILPLAHISEWLFLLGGGCTLAYMIKLFVVLFIEKPTPESAAHSRAGAKKQRSLSAVSATALVLAALPTAVTGIPAVARHLAMRGMTFAGGSIWHEVDFFSWECLSGSVITITIGLCLYSLFVRTVTRRRGKYVNILPVWADLERSVYVPVIHGVTYAGGAVLRLFGENVVTSRLCRAGLRISEIICHAATDLVDAAVYVLRRTVFRQSPAHERRKRAHPLIDAIYRERAVDNFSYSLIVTAIGVCVILLFLFIVPRI